jgi:hypothetical protein
MIDIKGDGGAIALPFYFTKGLGLGLFVTKIKKQAFLLYLFR